MKRLLLLLVFALAALAPRPALAQANTAKAKELFTAGVAAYEDGKFLAAAQAFVEAHKLIQKPQLLFSAAQAFRRQYDADNDQQHLRAAVKYYSEYLSVVKVGGRRVDAARALGELKPQLRDGEGMREMSFPTRVSVTAPVPEAVVSIDGGPWLAVPYNGEIAPGPHQVVVQASGYFEGKRAFVAEKGRIAPVDVPMKGIPPVLNVLGADGAEVTVDGRVIGEAPLAGGEGIDPGRHFVAVTSTGYKAYSGEIDFTYGAKTELTVDLPMTNQRRVAWGVLVTGGAAFVGAGVLGGLAFSEQSTAKEIGAAQTAGNINEDQRNEHNDAIEARNDLRLAALVVAGAGAAITVTGLFLYLFDEPVVTPPRSSSDEDEKEDDPKAPSDVEMIGAPVISPNQFGFTIVGRF